MNEELRKFEFDLEESRSLASRMAAFCAGKDCKKCILKTRPGGDCMSIEANKRLQVLQEQFRREVEAEEARRATQKTIEDMHNAMLTVKRDDWEIVNIKYAEDDTAAVAFIKKGTPLKPNMDPILTGDVKNPARARVMAIAKELTRTGCVGIACCECPFHDERSMDGRCFVSLIRERLERLNGGCVEG